VHLVARLRIGGFRLLDTQFVTSHLAQFGAVEIPREAYRAELMEAVDVEAAWPAASDEARLAAEIRALAGMAEADRQPHRQPRGESPGA
jgi:leucyl/phenylalanyl-tRNA---protein transferase